MAQAPPSEILSSSEDDRQIEISERTVTELLMHLISSFGEVEKLKEERNQLQHQLYRDGNDRIPLNSDSEDSLETGRTLQDHQTNMSSSRIGSVDRQHLTARNQTQIPIQGGWKPSQENELQIDKNQLTNTTDSGIGSGPDNSARVSRLPKREQRSTAMPDCCFPGSLSQNLGLSAFEISENINVKCVSPNEQSKQLNDAEMNIECDGAMSSSIRLPEEKDVFFSELQYMGSPHMLQRATSSRQDDQTSGKRKNEMKKTGSHESYFPNESKNDRGLPRQPSLKPVPGQRKFSYSAMSSADTTKALETADSTMISCLPQVASKTILNGVSNELRRVRKEYHRLEKQKEGLMEDIFHLKDSLTKMEIKFLETKKASEDVRKNRVEDDHNNMADVYKELRRTQAELEKEKKRNSEVEKMLEDERVRFNRDEGHLKSQIKTLKKQVRTEN